MANQSGIAITIKAFLPTGSTIDENFAAYGLVKAAHESGDYSKLLASAIDVKVKTDQQTRRVPDAPANPAPTTEEIAAAAAADAQRKADEEAEAARQEAEALARLSAPPAPTSAPELASPADVDLTSSKKPGLARSRTTPADDAARDAA